MAGDSPKKSGDLVVRAVSAAVMLGIAGFALWAGGTVWSVFVLVVGIGVWFEWSALCLRIYPPGRRRALWRYGGAIYCGMACAVLLALRDTPAGATWVLLVVGAVIGTDVGAYAFGRAIGGPRIAPSISPSKTWAGLVGGVFGASLIFSVVFTLMPESPAFQQVALDSDVLLANPVGAALEFLGAGAFVAVIAQSGDFFESWMKRRAGVKDSGKLIPGHGGLFDRVDGLLSVLVVLGFLLIAVQFSGPG